MTIHLDKTFSFLSTTALDLFFWGGGGFLDWGPTKVEIFIRTVD